MKCKVGVAFIFILCVSVAPGYENPVENQFTETVNGSLWNVGLDDIYVGSTTHGNTLIVRNGGIIEQDSSIILGNQTGASNNTLRIADPGSRGGLTYELVIGRQGAANSMIITNGALLRSDSATIGALSIGNSALITGAGSTWSNSFDVKVGGLSTGNSLAVRNGGSLATGELLVGDGPGSGGNQAVVSGTGSTLDVFDSGLFVGHFGKDNTLEVSDGGQINSQFGVIGENAAASNNSATVTGPGSLWYLAGTLQIGSSDNAGNTLTVTNGGTVSATGMTLNSNNSMHVQSGGTLKVNGDFNAAQAGTLDLSGGTLTVTGQLSGLSVLAANSRLETPSVLGNLTVHGTFAPGSSPADSLLNGNLNLASNAVLEMEIGGVTLGTEYDRLTVTGEAALDGTLSVVLLDGFSPIYGDTFDLFNWDGGTSNAFDDVALPTLSGGLDWDATNLYSDGSLSVIPEPATMGLFGLSSLGLLWMRRARNRRRPFRIITPVHREHHLTIPHPHFDAAAWWQVLGDELSNHEPLASFVICIRKSLVAIRFQPSIASLSRKKILGKFHTLENRFWDGMLIWYRKWLHSKSAAKASIRQKALDWFGALIARIMK